MLGKISRSGNIAAVAQVQSRYTYLYFYYDFLCQGCHLDIINFAIIERVAAWSFSNHTAETETEITCLEIFLAKPIHVTTSRAEHVVVCLNTGLHGAVAVLDIAESRASSPDAEVPLFPPISTPH